MRSFVTVILGELEVLMTLFYAVAEVCRLEKALSEILRRTNLGGL